jgi:hypothetical protein
VKNATALAVARQTPQRLAEGDLKLFDSETGPSMRAYATRWLEDGTTATARTFAATAAAQVRPPRKHTYRARDYGAMFPVSGLRSADWSFLHPRLPAAAARTDVLAIAMSTNPLRP